MRSRRSIVAACLAGVLSGLPAAAAWCLLTCTGLPDESAAVTACHETGGPTAVPPSGNFGAMAGVDCADHDGLVALQAVVMPRIDADVAVAPLFTAEALVAPVWTTGPAFVRPPPRPHAASPAILRI